MSDRELLELAAKAVGFDTTHRMNAERLQLDPPVDALLVRRDGELVTTGWNPLADDGDALRLAVKIKCATDVGGNVCFAIVEDINFFEEQAQDFGGDLCAAMRRAIVKAAAAIGKAMP